MKIVGLLSSSGVLFLCARTLGRAPFPSNQSHSRTGNESTPFSAEQTNIHPRTNHAATHKARQSDQLMDIHSNYACNPASNHDAVSAACVCLRSATLCQRSGLLTTRDTQPRVSLSPMQHDQHHVCNKASENEGEEGKESEPLFCRTAICATRPRARTAPGRRCLPPALLLLLLMLRLPAHRKHFNTDTPKTKRHLFVLLSHSKTELRGASISACRGAWRLEHRLCAFSCLCGCF